MANQATSVTKSDVLRLAYHPHIEALEKTCEHFNYSMVGFSILREQESTLCLMFDEENETWEVFCYERGYRHDVTSFSRIDDACICLLEKLAYSNDEFNECRRWYWNEVEKLKEDFPSATRVAQVLRNIS